MTAKKRKLLTFIIFFILSAGFGYLMSTLIIHSDIVVSKITIMVVLISIIPSFLIVIAIHEAGHAYAGIKMNFDFRMFVVGPFLWTKEQSKWFFKWNKNVNTAGGLVVCLPTDTDDLHKRFTIYAAGGPLASLLLTILGFLFFITFRNLNTQNQLGLEITSALFLLVAVFSLFILMITAIPFHSGGFSSDGARILRILKGGKAADFELLMLKIIAHTTSGVRPKDIKVEELNEALMIAKKLNLPQGVYLHGMLHQTEFDLGNLENAEIHLKNYLNDIEEIPAGMRNMVYMDAAFFYALANEDLTLADSYWQKFKINAFVAACQVFATEAAICVLKNQNEVALLKINESFKNIPNMLDKGLGIALTEKLNLLRNKIQNTG